MHDGRKDESKPPSQSAVSSTNASTPPSAAARHEPRRPLSAGTISYVQMNYVGSFFVLWGGTIPQQGRKEGGGAPDPQGLAPGNRRRVGGQGKTEPESRTAPASTSVPRRGVGGPPGKACRRFPPQGGRRMHGAQNACFAGRPLMLRRTDGFSSLVYFFNGIKFVSGYRGVGL